MQQPQLIASDIIMARETEPIETTEQLKAAVQRRLPRGKENKVLAQLFQALRIEVNQELDALTAFLSQCPDVLKPGGRLVVMSYHSLEDRLVKNFMKTGNAEGKEEKDFFGNLLTPYHIITRKPIVPSDEETESNSRARSAKLRIAEKK
jgi:16S rRNA (cytosine1402-N4)-methyltransferase